MGCPKLQKFLWYFDLASGCIFIGFYCVFINVIGIIFLLIELFFDGKEHLPVDFPKDKSDPTKGAPILLFGLRIALHLGFIILFLYIVWKIKQRNKKAVREFSIILAFFAVISLIAGVLSQSVFHLVDTIILSYFAYCMYSFFDMIRNEEEEAKKNTVDGSQHGFTKPANDNVDVEAGN